MTSKQIKELQEITVELGLNGLRLIQAYVEEQVKNISIQILKGVILTGLCFLGITFILYSLSYYIGQSFMVNQHLVLLYVGTLLLLSCIAIICFNKVRSRNE
jgi:uncharacterized membrane protein YqjE